MSKQRIGEHAGLQAALGRLVICAAVISAGCAAGGPADRRPVPTPPTTVQMVPSPSPLGPARPFVAAAKDMP